MNNKVGGGTRVLMYAVAGLLDLFQGLVSWVPLVGFVLAFIVSPIIYICALCLFWVWYKAYDINIFSGKMATRTFITMLAELLLGGILPGILAFVHTTLRESDRLATSQDAV